MSCVYIFMLLIVFALAPVGVSPNINCKSDAEEEYDYILLCCDMLFVCIYGHFLNVYCCSDED